MDEQRREVGAVDEQRRDVGAVVRATTDAVRGAGRFSASAVAASADSAVGILTRRVVATALARPRPVPDAPSLARALSDQPSPPTVGTATAAALAARAASRLGPLRFLARRTPMWILAVVGPALYEAVSRGADELGLVASHLVLRARAAGVEPDPERLRRAAVQISCGRAVDPEMSPPDGGLAFTWLRRALRSTLPLAHSVGTGHPDRVAGDAARVPPDQLAPRSDDR